MDTNHLLSAAAAIPLLVAAGCSHEPPPGAATTTSARAISNDEAVKRLTATRCDREASCSNIGRNRRFEDRAACTYTMKRDSDAVLRPEICVAGVDEAKLTTCLSDIRDERCSDALDTIERISSCRHAELCVR